MVFLATIAKLHLKVLVLIRDVAIQETHVREEETDTLWTRDQLSPA